MARELLGDGSVIAGDVGVSAPLVSVIVPVYNVEDYLALSLESVRGQTLADIEIVCVDDGSTDHSGQLLAAAAAQDERIRVITKPNGGLSSARNAGLDAARGRYVCFLDSDDLMVAEACERIVGAFEATGADVVTYGATPYPPVWATEWTKIVLSPRNVVYDGFDAAVLFEEQSHPFAWRTACERAFLERYGLRFDETLPYGEDQVFHFQVYPRARRTALIADKLVDYRVVREGSLMSLRAANPVARTGEHIDIVAALVADWDGAGFLAANAQAMFDWIIWFVGLDVAIAAGADRALLREKLRAVFLGHFDGAFLEAQCAHPRHGFIVSEVVGPDRESYAGRPDDVYRRYYDPAFESPVPPPYTGELPATTPNPVRARLHALGLDDEREFTPRAEYFFRLYDREARVAATSRLL